MQAMGILPMESSISQPSNQTPTIIERQSSNPYFTLTLFNLTTSSDQYVTSPMKIFDDFNSSIYGGNTTQEYFNSSRNQTLDDEEIQIFSIYDIILVGVFCLLIVVTIIGNTLVILAVVTTRRLRTVTNCFVTSLAVADWLVGICVMPPAVAFHIMGRWSLGWVLCDLWISMDVMLCTASILSLCAISVDRYLAVTQPLNYSRRRRSKRLALLMILGVWAAAIAITCPPILGWYERDRRECRYNQNSGYVVFSAMGSFFLPMVVMLYVYLRISCVVAQRHHQLASAALKGPKRFSRCACLRAESDVSESPQAPPGPNSAPPAPPQPYARHCSCHTHYKLKRSATVSYKSGRPSRVSIRSKHCLSEHDHQTNRVSSLRRETKTAQTLSIVVGGFIICWLPFFVYYLITPFLPKECVNSTLMSFLTWLGWFNSAINPFIYAFYSPDFRIAFWRLTLKKCTQGRKPDQFHHK